MGHLTLNSPMKVGGLHMVSNLVCVSTYVFVCVLPFDFIDKIRSDSWFYLGALVHIVIFFTIFSQFSHMAQYIVMAHCVVTIFPS